jgi:hypothetical protein
MRALDLETNTYHNVVTIDYDTNMVILESEQYVRTYTTIDKVKLLMDSKEDLKGKTIIKPENFWMIPFVGWFMIFYKLFFVKNAVIDFGPSTLDYLRQSLIMMGPILLLITILILINFK